MNIEEEVGSIEIGKFADMIVVDRNLFEIPVDEISECKVLVTLLSGKVVFDATSSPFEEEAIEERYEVELDFTAANDYQALVEFPATIEVFDSDIVAAYILEGIDNGIDIWEPLPQTLFLGSDILLYGYNHTFFDINFFMDGTFDISTLDPIYTDGLIFRVAIIPADFAANLNLSDMNQVMDALQIETVLKVHKKK